MRKWLVFKDGAHLVDGDKAVCGAKLNVSEGRGYGPRPVSLKNCQSCLAEIAKK